MSLRESITQFFNELKAILKEYAQKQEAALKARLKRMLITSIIGAVLMAWLYHWLDRRTVSSSVRFGISRHFLCMGSVAYHGCNSCSGVWSIIFSAFSLNKKQLAPPKEATETYEPLKSAQSRPSFGLFRNSTKRTYSNSA